MKEKWLKAGHWVMPNMADKSLLHDLKNELY